MPSATQNNPKRAKKTTKERGISLTIMGQRSIYNSIHKPHQSQNEMLGFNQDDHPYRMCNETGIPEFLEFVRAPCTILPNKILSTGTPYLYISVTLVSSSEEPSSVHYAI